MPYFVRVKDKAFGPFDENQLLAMKTNGKLVASTEVSENRVQWQPASQFPFLGFQNDVYTLDSSGGGSSTGFDPNQNFNVSNSSNEPANWFYSVNGTEGFGPVTASAIGQMVQTGTLQATSLVWQEGQNSQRLGSVPAFASYFGAPQSNPFQATHAYAPTASAAYCPTCNHPLAPNASSCSRCGANLHFGGGYGAPGYPPSNAGQQGIGYFDVLKKYAVFEGRARRKEYWMFVLYNGLIYIFALLFGGGIMAATENGGAAEVGMMIGGGIILLYWVYNLAILIPSLAVCVRRLHDAGYSGWMILVSFVPCVGGLILLFFLVQDSQPGPNMYGPNPKTG